MLDLFISSFMNFVLTLLFLARSTMSYATCMCVDTFGLHPPCFRPDISGFQISLSSSNFNPRDVFDNNHLNNLMVDEACTFPKLYKHKLATRKLKRWLLESTVNQDAPSVVDVSCDRESKQILRENSFKVFPTGSLDHHDNQECEGEINDLNRKLSNGSASAKVAGDFLGDRSVEDMNTFQRNIRHFCSLQETKVEEGQKLLGSSQEYVSFKERLSTQRQMLKIVHDELERQRIVAIQTAQEAMSTISMLQKEKAALLLEALQYKRMAEEKEMFDEDSIIHLRGSLVKREAKLLVLEKEVELYRRKILKIQADSTKQKQLYDACKVPLPNTQALQNGQRMYSKEEDTLPGGDSSARSSMASYRAMKKDIVGHSVSSSAQDLRSESMIARDNSRGVLRKEVGELLSRLQVVEADRELMRQTIELRRKEHGEFAWLQEVAGLLRLLQVRSQKRRRSGL